MIGNKTQINAKLNELNIDFGPYYLVPRNKYPRMEVGANSIIFHSGDIHNGDKIGVREKSIN